MKKSIFKTWREWAMPTKHREVQDRVIEMQRALDSAEADITALKVICYRKDEVIKNRERECNRLLDMVEELNSKFSLGVELAIGTAKDADKKADFLDLIDTTYAQRHSAKEELRRARQRNEAEAIKQLFGEQRYEL